MWHEYGRGGHFPAAAEPELLAQTAEGLTRPVIEQSLQWADNQRQDDQLQT